MAFGLTRSGKVRPMAWRVCCKAGLPGITLSTATAKVEPADLAPFLDPEHAGRLAAAGAAAASRSAAAVKQAGGGMGAPVAGWRDLWAPTAAWTTDVSSTVALGELTVGARDWL